MVDFFESVNKDVLDRIIIRLIEKDDLPGLEWEGEYRHFRRIYQMAYQRATRGLSLLWVVELEGEGIIGQIFIQIVCDRLELADGKNRAYFYSFRIRPKYRCLGIGTKVLEVIEKDLCKRGFRAITLNVAKTNKRARELYERVGYKIIAHEPGIWSYIDHQGEVVEVHEPAWRMEKDISG